MTKAKDDVGGLLRNFFPQLRLYLRFSLVIVLRRRVSSSVEAFLQAESGPTMQC